MSVPTMLLFFYFESRNLTCCDRSRLLSLNKELFHEHFSIRIFGLLKKLNFDPKLLGQNQKNEELLATSMSQAGPGGILLQVGYPY